MSLVARLSSIFKRSERPRQAVPARRPASEPTRRPPLRPLSIRWREIIDGTSSIAAYLLSPLAPAAGTRIFGTTLLQALADEGCARLIEQRKAVVPITLTQWHEADFRPLATPNTFFLLSTRDSGGASLADLRELATAIRAAGGKVAADAHWSTLNADEAPPHRPARPEP